MDMFAGGNGGKRHFFMQRVGGCNRDNMDRRVIDEITPIVGYPAKSILSKSGSTARLIVVGDHFENRLVLQWKNTTRRPIGERM